MKFYSISNIKEVLNIGIRTFWMMHRNIDRHNAEDDIRQIHLIVNAANGGDGLTSLIEKLQDRIGEIIKIKETRPAILKVDLDREGLESLKSLGALK